MISTVYEISEKSKVKSELDKEIPFPMTRNLDNFIISLQEEEYKKIAEICRDKGCKFWKIGKIG